ncbi:uncharacterized protein LOC133286325 [Gastrolobium bilobum]|uniref:uncharacterized protein LOC133286325 n=1 Tax=Gastrolobium bilobum TaxID=150636 RepID=UPI002AB19529|nr:uncharacterized protein LOC133286325 [Gastrolobium bilobum]
MATVNALNPEPENSCCAELKKKCSKLQESRNALRQAVKLLEQRINVVEAQNVNLDKAYREEQMRVKIEEEAKLKESNARVCLENEVSALKSEITTLQQKCGAGAQEGNGDVEVLQACIYDRETEINRLKELLKKEKIKADSWRKFAEDEKKKAAEARKLLEVEKNKSVEKEMQLPKIEAEKAEEYRVQQVQLGEELTETKMKLASEVSKFKEATKRFEAENLKLLVEKRNAESEMEKAQERVEVEKQKAAREKRCADAEFVKVEEQKKLAEYNWKRAMEAKCLADQMSQKIEEDKRTIEDLKQKIHELSVEKRNAESEMEKAQERVEVEKQKAAREKRRADAEFVKVHELSVEKRNAESEMEKAQERVEVQKQKAAREKRRADAEFVKVEEQKKLAEDNWKRAMEAKCLADQMSQKIEEDKRTIEDLKQKIHELSSLRKPNEISEVSPDVSVNDESTKVQLLENSLEKLRAKHARKKIELKHARKTFKDAKRNFECEASHLSILQHELSHANKKFKSEATHRSILQHELSHLKLDVIQIIHHLDMLDASFSPVTGSIHGLTKVGFLSELFAAIYEFGNFPYPCPMTVYVVPTCRRMSQNVRNMQKSQVENELMKPCSTSTGACDPLRKIMQDTPLLALSGGMYADPMTSIDSKSAPLIIKGFNRTLESSAVKSSEASFSDAQLMSSQETGALQVTALTELAQENPNARPSMSNPSDRSVIEHDRLRSRILDTVECIADLSSEGKKLNMQVEDKLCDLRGLLYSKMDKSIEGGREMVTNDKDYLQEKSDRAHKKRNKSHRAKADTSVDGKEGRGKMKSGAWEDANDCIHTPCPASYTPTTQTCRERIYDAPDIFDEVDDGNVMQLLDLENAADEEYYKNARDVPLSPFFPEIETFDSDNLKPFLEEALHEDLLSQRELFTSTRCDVLDVEINSNEQNIDAFTVPSNTHLKSAQARISDIELPDMHTSENLTATFLEEAEIGSLRNQLPNFCFVLSDTVDNSSISRKFHATRNCIARCSLDTQTEWAVASILSAVELQEMPLQKEKHSVLLTLLLFNFNLTAAMKFGKLCHGNLILCLNSYAQHIHRVMTDADTRILFLEKLSLQEFLYLIEDFLIVGKVIFKNILPTETLSENDLRTNNFPDGVDTLFSEVASSEQLVAASIILASLCAATDHVGFICDASYNILRLCRWDSLTVLTILHIFANLGGGRYFDSDNFGLMVTVLKSLVMFLEDESISVTTASCLPSINQLHTELCTGIKCPFSEGAESIDIVTLSLLEMIKNCLRQQAEQLDSSNSRFLPENYNAGQWSNQEVVQCASSMNCDAPCCLKNHVICPTQSDVINVTLCQLSDILSLLELVANKMCKSWQWTNDKLVPQLLNILDSCVVENFAVAIIVLLGQLGRLGVDIGGYEDGGVQNLRCNLFSYLCRNSSVKASPSSLQIAAATALFGLLPLDFETLLQTKSSLPAYSSKSVSDDAGNLRKWFSGLGRDQQDLLYGILRSTNVS